MSESEDLLIIGEEKTADGDCTLFFMPPSEDTPCFTVDPDWRDVAWFAPDEMRRLRDWITQWLGDE